MAPAVSVIVITYNEERNLPHVLDSLLAQTYHDFEVLVIDSKSTDGTAAVAKRYRPRFKRFLFHRMRNRGASLGRNTGARKASGRILIFMDADIVFDKGFLATTVKEFTRRRLGVAGIYMRTDSAHLLDRLYYWTLNCWFFLTQKVYPHVVGSCMVASRSAHRAIDGFDLSITLAEDNDYIWRARKQGIATGMIPASVVCSARRFKKDGRFRMGIKYVLVLLHRVFLGEIRTDVFRYRFGHYDAKK